MKQSTLWAAARLAGCIYFSTLAVGCEDAAKQDGDTASTPDSGGAADVISGATPGVASAVPGENHEGLGRVDCFECHDSGHVHNYVLGDCVTCHGKNNAPPRCEHNDDLGCIDCHGNAHPEVSLPSNETCRACHAREKIADDCVYTETYDAVVIGGGGGGLAAAAQLAKAGWRVMLVEQHYKTGGCMVTFKRGEYRFEASLHAYDGWGLSYLNALGIDRALKPTRGDIMYRIVFPDTTFDVPSDKRAYLDALKTAFPEEAAHLDEFFENFGVANTAQYAGISLLDAVHFHGIENPRLVYILTALSEFLAATPDEIPALDFLGMWDSYHSMGYYYFEGGSQAITDALEQQIEDNGGIIKRHTRANRISLENNRVTGVHTEDGGCYMAKTVISNAGAEATYFGMVGRQLLPSELTEEVNRRTPAASRIAMIYLGVDADYTDLFPGGTHEMFIAAEERLTTEEINEVRCTPEAVSYMLTNYSAVDPAAAPEGKNAIVISVDFMDYDCADQWNWGESYKSYEEYKAELARVLVERAAMILPGLGDHIEILEVASPKTIEQFTLNERGSWAGWAFEPDAEHVFTNATETPVAGLYMAGAWVAGAGQSVALASGIDAANAALQYLE